MELGGQRHATPLSFYSRGRDQVPVAARDPGPVWISAENFAPHRCQYWYTCRSYDANRFFDWVIQLYFHKDPRLGRCLVIQTPPITRKDFFFKNPGIEGNHMVRHPRCVFINYNWINQLSNTTIWWLDICCLLHRYQYMFRLLWPSSGW